MKPNVSTMWSLVISFVVVLSQSNLQSYADNIWNPAHSSPLSSPSSLSLSSHAGSFNFLSVSRSIGEVVIVVHLDDVSAIKKVVGNQDGVQMIVLQATDGRHLVQNIYDPMYELKECKATKHQADIDDFRRSFHAKHSPDFLPEDEPHLFHGSKTNMKLFSSTSFNAEYIYDAEESREFFALPRSGSKGFKVHPTIRIMLDVMGARRACRDMEKGWKTQLMMTDQSRNDHGDGSDMNDHDNAEEVDVDDDEEERRSRDRRSIFIVTGTLWCGAGDVAKSYDDLGEYNTTDMCCREHDHCPNTINSWQNKFKIFNHRLYTISDCDCDKKFRDCLLNVGDSISRAVGDAYFNLLGCACFRIEEEEECISRSWWPWNACSRYQQIKRAIVKAIGPVMEFLS